MIGGGYFAQFSIDYAITIDMPGRRRITVERYKESNEALRSIFHLI